MRSPQHWAAGLSEARAHTCLLVGSCSTFRQILVQISAPLCPRLSPQKEMLRCRLKCEMFVWNQNLCKSRGTSGLGRRKSHLGRQVLHRLGPPKRLLWNEHCLSARVVLGKSEWLGLYNLALLIDGAWASPGRIQPWARWPRAADTALKGLTTGVCRCLCSL